MATRAQITVKGSSVFIYKHNDGYPEGVLPTLSAIASRFADERGVDHEYLTAQIVRHFAYADLKEAPRETLKLTGWGVSAELHADIDFLYVVQDDGTIEVRRPSANFFDTPSIANTKLV